MTILSWVCITAGMTAVAQVRGWRGLIPLHSSRVDVVRVLGPPTEKLHKYQDFYRTSNETVLITYAAGFPCGIGENHSQWRVPRDTVENISVTPSRPLSISELRLDQAKYEKRSGGHRPEDVYYINDDVGESIRVFRGEVMGISFYPGRADTHLACSDLPPNPDLECQGLTPPVLHSYGNIPREQEKLLLDNFAITLLRDQSSMGYIIAYAGQRTLADEAKELTERAKNYLLKARRVPSTQLKAIDGGYRQERQVELYVVPRKFCPPVPDPTVDPGDVRIIKSHKLRRNRRLL